MRIVFVLLVIASLLGCTTTTETTVTPASRQPDKPAGFFSRMMDQITERECLVSRFSCPYGLGPAGEPCECTDPSGRVWQGRTFK